MDAFLLPKYQCAKIKKYLFLYIVLIQIVDEEREPADTNKLYELLEISKEATSQEIKKAYRKIAMKAHPDKGGDVEKFKEINQAYEVLSNEDKRATYDKYGLDGLKDGGGGGPGGNL